jgi:hypothetical protein
MGEWQAAMADSINVYITVDTEFSAGGHFHNSAKVPITDRSVYREIGGQSHGLGFMLKTLKETGLKATFFVEGAHTYLLGFEEMRRPVQEILEAGQIPNFTCTRCGCMVRRGGWDCR